MTDHIKSVPPGSNIVYEEDELGYTPLYVAGPIELTKSKQKESPSKDIDDPQISFHKLHRDEEQLNAPQYEVKEKKNRRKTPLLDGEVEEDVEAPQSKAALPR